MDVQRSRMYNGAVYYILFLTERCNLECSYCERRSSRIERTQDIKYSVDDLVRFLAGDPEVHLQLYGGEPMLCLPLIEEILARVPARSVCMQTNGFFLDRIGEHLFDVLRVLSVSIDGPREITDACRGAGVYDTVVEQVTRLRERGFPGEIDARMTTTPGVRIYDAVHHLTDECSFSFDSIYWQLNALFGAHDWRMDKRFIRKWFETVYNPQITRLVDEWADEIERSHRVRKIIPFAVTLWHILEGHQVDWVQCGAGKLAWTITPEGEIVPCPVFRASPDYVIGTIHTIQPSDIHTMTHLRGPCRDCEVLELCGGRCVYASESMRWGQEGFDLVCDATKHMLREIGRVAPRVQKLVDQGAIQLSDYAGLGRDYEVIP